MFLNRFPASRISIYGKFHCNISSKAKAVSVLYQKCCYSCLTNEKQISKLKNRRQINSTVSIYQTCLVRTFFSKGLLDGILRGGEQSRSKDIHDELDTIATLFPNPRATLNNFASKSKEKVFEVSYRQQAIAPKGKKKKQLVSSDWTCCYTFVWPEKMKFESTAKAKRQAADRTALQALQWLYDKGRIDRNGHPIYDREKLDEIKSKLNDVLQVNLSSSSMERVDKIWKLYESGIKEIFEMTHENALKEQRVNSTGLFKDSTIDNDDDFMDNNIKYQEREELVEMKSLVHPVYGKAIVRPTLKALERRQRALQSTLEAYNENKTPLPIDKYSEQIVSTVKNNRVTVLVGAAGCGKSTRAPAAILCDAGVKMAAVVSEPRRVAAVGLASRVASEFGEDVGDTIGYQVRLGSKPPRPPAASILYCTSGVLLKRLQVNPGLEGCTHVFIDEAHERDVNTDLTLLLLKRALDVNEDLRIVIMSATLDVDVFTRYFDACPVIEVPGRTFPVSISYLDDIRKKYRLDLAQTKEMCSKDDSKPIVCYDEVVDLIKAIDRNEPEGAILVFLPGWADIKNVRNALTDTYGRTNRHMILPVHSRLSTEDQTKIFSVPIPGVRKIVLATNIAETSITIPDVVYVVDSGTHKENRIKEGTGMSSLETVWVSNAAAQQRAGRAGRVRTGHCFRMYTKEREEQFEAFLTPEILRVPLDQTVLDCKAYAPTERIVDFLSQLPEPPPTASIDFAVNDLIDLGALTRNEELTPLGLRVSALPLRPRLATALVHSVAIGNTLAMADVVTYIADDVGVFRMAQERRDEIREIKSKYSKTSDHTALHWLQYEYEQKCQSDSFDGLTQWCDRKGIRMDRMKYVKALSSLYLEQLINSGIIDKNANAEALNAFSGIDELTTSTLLSASNSLLVTKRTLKTKGKLNVVKGVFTSKGERAHVGGESVNYAVNKTSSNPRPELLTYFGGFHSQDRRALVVHKTSRVTPHAAILFCRGNFKMDDSKSPDAESTVITLPRHNLHISVPKSQVDNLLKTKKMLWETLQYYYERDTSYLDSELDTIISRFRSQLVKTLGRILVEASDGHNLNQNEESDDELNN